MNDFIGSKAKMQPKRLFEHGTSCVADKSATTVPTNQKIIGRIITLTLIHTSVACHTFTQVTAFIESFAPFGKNSIES